jgi:hypothetical protein
MMDCLAAADPDDPGGGYLTVEKLKIRSRSKMMRCKEAKKPGRAVYFRIHKRSGFFR